MFKSLAPGFLLATPTLQDPNFAKTVVLVFHHAPEGALGLVVNRPTDRKLEGLLEETGLKPANPLVSNLPICLGGPVSTGSGWVIFEGPDPRGQSFPVKDNIKVTGSIEVLRDLVALPRPPRMQFCLGYSGWSAGQLDSEVETGAWMPIPLDLRFLFEVEVEDRWRKAFLSVGIDPSLWSFQSGDG